MHEKSKCFSAAGNEPNHMIYASSMENIDAINKS